MRWSKLLKTSGTMAANNDPYIGLGLSYEISKNTSFAFDYITTASTNAIEGVALDLSGYSISWLRSF